MEITREQVLGFRVRAQHLDRDGGGSVADTAVLDFGVQDTGPDGAGWALAIRGLDKAALDGDDALAYAWTLRGAPHAYRRADLPGIAAATAPFSEADAAKRVFDAAKPLKAAGIPVLDALDTVAAAMRGIVTAPMVKGEVSTRLTAALPEPYLRWCRSCRATHSYEQPFRLAALRAGLELVAGTSPPVLRPVPRFRTARRTPDALDVVRGYLRLLGPATPKHVAGFLDAALADVKARWPEDAVEVTVGGERRRVLDADADAVRAGPAPVTRLLGPYDLFVQAKDRDLLVADPTRAKALWPVLGRPGVLLVDGDLAGLWRPRQSGGRLTVLLDPWAPLPKRALAAVEGEAERLAAYRGVRLSAVTG